METEQLNNYKIEFYSEEEYKEHLENVDNGIITLKHSKGLIEHGLVSDISEELAEKIVERSPQLENGYRLWNDYNDKLLGLETAKQSFQTLSDLPYCVITKIE